MESDCLTPGGKNVSQRLSVFEVLMIHTSSRSKWGCVGAKQIECIQLLSSWCSANTISYLGFIKGHLTLFYLPPPHSNITLFTYLMEEDLSKAQLWSKMMLTWNLKTCWLETFLTTPSPRASRVRPPLCSSPETSHRPACRNSAPWSGISRMQLGSVQLCTSKA